MKLEGEIRDTDIIGLLVQLWRERFTGALRFEHDDLIKILYLRQGEVLSASTNDRIDSIDDVLLRAGKITKDHVKLAIAKRGEQETLGDALLTLGSISRKELIWARRVQVVGVIRSVLSWAGGSYTLVADYLPKREEGTIFHLPQIIVEVLITGQDREAVEQELQGGEAIFVKGPQFDSAFKRLALNEEADRVASQIDGQRTVGDIASQSPTDSFAVYKLLHAFHLLGMIERKGKPQPSLQVSSALLPGVKAMEPADDASVMERLDEFSSTIAALDPAVMDHARLEELAEQVRRDEAAMEWDNQPVSPSPAAVVAERRSRSWMIPVMILFLAALGVAGFYAWNGGSQASAEKPALAANRPPGALPPSAQKASEPSRIGGFETRPPTPTGVQSPASVAASGPDFAAERNPQRPVTPATAMVTSPPNLTVPPAPSPKVAGFREAKPSASVVGPGVATKSSSRKPVVSNSSIRVENGPEGVKLSNLGSTPAAKRKVVASTSGSDADRARYDRMASAHVNRAGKKRYAIQFALVCQTSSVETSLRQGGESVWFVPTTFRGQGCYRMMWKEFDSRSEAESAISSLPSSLKEGSRPAVVSTGAGVDR